jgi:hypothetical protein
MMKDTEIVEILEDGTVYHFDMAVCNAEAEQVLATLWSKEDNQLGFDYTATVYSLFARAVHILSQSGWSMDELVDAVLTHAVDDPDAANWEDDEQ